MFQSPTQPQKNGPWAWNTSLPRDKGFIQAVPGLLPGLGIPFPVLGSRSVPMPLFCLRVYVNGPEAYHHLSGRGPSAARERSTAGHMAVGAGGS